MTLGDVIKDARVRKSIKQSEVAEYVGVTVQTYIKWETNETEPKASQVAKLSKILGVSTSAICNGEENKKMELTKFMRVFSKIQKYASDFEIALTVWENLENDENFIAGIRKNANLEFIPYDTKIDPATGDIAHYGPDDREITDPLGLI